MAEMSLATENIATPENLSKKPAKEGHNLLAAKEPQSSQSEGPQHSTNHAQCELNVPVKPEPEDEEMEDVQVKEECRLDDTVHGSQQAEGKTFVGKVKIKPMTSLVDTNPPNPKPTLHPFFAGFDDHIRSLIMNRQPQFSMNSPLYQSPVRFMYYDNSTNMNLKKMLNGHKMAPVPRHPTFRPYVPINVPRPPRVQVPHRTSFSTQTPPFMDTHPDLSATPSTSYQWHPQSRPPLPKLNPINYLPAHNLPLPKTNSATTPNPKIMNLPPPTPSSACHNPATPNFPMPRSIVKDEAPSNKVSTSSSTEDLEDPSENNLIIKTEVDLDIESEEDLQATVNDGNLGTQSDLPDSEIPLDVKLETTETKHPVLTGDVITEVRKQSVEMELPSYSTKGMLLCKCCDFRCNRKTKMKEHLETMHTAKNHFKCFYCVKKLFLYHFKSVHDLEHHVAKVHRGEKRWQCKYCSRSYKCRTSFKAHMDKMCSQSHPYACHKCTFTCVTEAALEKHMKSHEKASETQECPFCNKIFKKFYLKQHLITVHAPPEEKPFHCSSCDFATGTQSVLDNHYRRTGHDKKIKCDQCDYSCRYDSSLKAHVETVHIKGVNSLVCGVDGCQTKCSNKISLKVHRRMHTMPESELFTCPDKECSKKFASHQSLRCHNLKTNHHKSFKCTDCSFRALKEDSLNNHIQTIHVRNIMKKMEKEVHAEPVCVKNVVDVFNYVEGMGGSDPDIEEDSVANFGCWLGISGFGDSKTNSDQDPQAVEDDDIQAKKTEFDDEDDEYQSLVPITCLVEVKQEDMLSNPPVKTEVESPDLVKEEDDDDDLEYQHITPEVSCLVECQQNPTMDSSTATDFEDNEQDTECFPTNLVKVEVEDTNVS